MYLPLNLGMVEPTVHTLSASCSRENFLSLYTQHCICVCNIPARLSLLPSHPPSTSHPVLVSRKTKRLATSYISTLHPHTPNHLVSRPTYSHCTQRAQEALNTGRLTAKYYSSHPPPHHLHKRHTLTTPASSFSLATMNVVPSLNMLNNVNTPIRTK